MLTSAHAVSGCPLFLSLSKRSIFTVLSCSIFPQPPLTSYLFCLHSNWRKVLRSIQLLEHQYLMESGTPFKDQHFKTGLARHIWIAHYGYLSQIKHSTLLQDRLFSKLIMTVVLPAVFLFLLCVCLLLKCTFFFCLTQWLILLLKLRGQRSLTASHVLHQGGWISSLQILKPLNKTSQTPYEYNYLGFLWYLFRRKIHLYNLSTM